LRIAHIGPRTISEHQQHRQLAAVVFDLDGVLLDSESVPAAVEDSTNGLLAAAAAGMLVVAVPNREFPPTEQALSLADLVVGSLDELTPAVLQAPTA
jgi:beta-phosphoglucomutase-like phosphatase (HAD superfamily)